MTIAAQCESEGQKRMIDWLEGRPAFSTFLGALAVGALGIISIHSPVPTLLSPWSAPVSVALLYAVLLTEHNISGELHESILSILAILPVMVFFAAWSFRLFSGQCSIPRRSLILFLILAGLCLIVLGSEWQSGLKYQGLTYTAAMIGYNLLAITALILLWRANRRAPRFWSNLFFHAGIFSWLAWCALPWLGELI